MDGTLEYLFCLIVAKWSVAYQKQQDMANLLYTDFRDSYSLRIRISV